MWDSANTTAGWNSQLSFHEYPPHKPFINSTYRTLRPSATAALPESNRDHLFTALQSLSLRIKSLEKEREEAQSNLRQITEGILRPPATTQLPDERPKKTRAKKRVSPTNDVEGRHYHLDMNSVPFILGASTAPSHNVKSNVQNVIALLKSHNHQLCLTSKEYAEMLQPHLKGDLSPHTLLYLDHYQRTAAPSRPSSVSPVRHRPRRRPQTAAVTSEKKCYSRMKHLRQEFATLTREHQRLSTSRSNPRELEIINRRMEIILEELDQLQRQLRQTTTTTTTNRRSTSTETPLETLRKTRLLQVILKDASQKEQHQGRSHRRTRPPTSSSVDG